MASYNTPKKGVAFRLYIGLRSQSSNATLQSNPTIASGDVKVSIDGGALANLTTLPSVVPAASKMVQIDLSAAEMNGDNVTVVCSDAAGAEWADLIINIQTTARQIDDLAYPATSGRSLAIDTSGQVSVGAIANGAIAAATFAANALDAVWSTATRVLTAGTNIVLAKGTGLTGLNDLSAAQVNAEADTALADVGLTAIVTGRIDAAISSRLASASYTAPPTATQNADALLDRADAVETGLTLRQALRLALAALAGKLSVAATNTITIRNAVADSKDRIVATVDADGNRTAVTTDVS